MNKSVLLAAVVLLLPTFTHATIITSGEVVVDMRGTSLDANSTTWLNMSTSLDTVGDFTTNDAANLNVVSIGDRPALYVGGNGSKALHSTLAAPASLLGASPGSVEAWVYVPGAFVADNTIVAWGQNNNSGTASRGFRYAAGGAYNSGMFTAWYQDKNWSNTADLLSDQWVYVTWVYDGNMMYGYINGALKTTVDIDPELNTLAAGTLAIGSRNGGSTADAFRGYITDLRVQTGILSASDVLNNYNAGTYAVPEPGVVALLGLGGLVLVIRFARRARAAA